MGRCGRRVLGAVQAGVGIAFWAISTPAARSTGIVAEGRPARMPQERRSETGSTCSMPENVDSRSDGRHEDAFPRRVPGSRIVGPFSVSRCARWINRSQIASATDGSPIAACHAVGGSWLAMRVEARSLRSSITSSRSRRSASVSGASSQSSIAKRSSLASFARSRAYDPSPRLTASSCSTRGARMYVAVKPWRQALCTKAEANHDFPIPVGPVIRRL